MVKVDDAIALTLAFGITLPDPLMFVLAEHRVAMRLLPRQFALTGSRTMWDVRLK